MTDKKKILFVFGGECFKLPPFLTILDSLMDKYSIQVLCHELPENYRKLKEVYKDSGIEFCNIVDRRIPSRTLSARIKNRLRRYLKVETPFHKALRKAFPTLKYDKLWIIHENTLAEIQDLLAGREYTISMYELNDARKGFLDEISEALRAAEKVIVCEPNRAQILRVWLKLAKTPDVVPNKPLKHPRTRKMPTPKPLAKEGEKVLLYQGHIQPNRNVEAFCKAIEGLQGFSLALMGARTEFRDELQRKYPFVKVFDFVNPPFHLNYTSQAYIGIVKYDYVDLNSIYCAPNKTFEYAGFGIPMIANDIPGLRQSVGAWGAAECIDTDDVVAIKEAVLKIDAEYEKYTKGATDFFESVDVNKLIEDIADAK